MNYCGAPDAGGSQLQALFGVSSGRGMQLPLSRMTSVFLYAYEVQHTSRTDRESQSGPSFYWAT